MMRVYLAEVRGAWLSWIAVSLTFVVTNFALCLALLVTGSYGHAADIGQLDADTAGGMTGLTGFNVFFVTLVALAVVGSATQLVVSSRRGAIARLALAGAAPRQIVATIMAQLTVVALAAAVVGDLLAVALQPWALRFVAGDEPTMVVPDAQITLWSFLVATAVCLAISLLGGLRQARAASKIPPVEALRQAAAAAPSRRSWAMWVKIALAALTLAGCLAGIRAASSSDDLSAAMSGALGLSMLTLIVGGLLLSASAPLTIAALTRAWTALVPGRSGTWHLARHTVIAKGDRLAKSVTPVMFAVGLLVGLMVLSDTLVASFVAAGQGSDGMSGSSLHNLLVLIGLPILVSISGAVGSLVMMTRQREAELALDGVLGATPNQQASIPVLEALIIIGTATLLSAFMVGIMLVAAAIALPTLIGAFAVSVPLGVLGVVVLACALVVVAATTLPTLGSLRQPAPKVIARLVAD